MFTQTNKIFLKTLMASAMMLVLSNAYSEVKIGRDINTAEGNNADITTIYSGNRGENGGGDQSLQFGDILQGTMENDLLVGALGIDVLLGGEGDDILVGGPEDFNPLNRDRALGQSGDDSFLWAPGDGNDFFDGGEGQDVLFMTLVGENIGPNGETEGAPFFGVSPPGTSGAFSFDGVFQESPNIPVIDVANGPGFCELVEADDQNTAGLQELGLDHLVRFVLRGPRAAFDAAASNIDPNTIDSGLRVSIHLKNVEFLVCSGVEAGTIKILDLRTVPAQIVDASALPLVAANLLSASTQPQ